MKYVSVPNTYLQCIKYKRKYSSNTGLQSHNPPPPVVDPVPTYPAPIWAHVLGLARSEPVFSFDCLCSHNTSLKVRSKRSRTYIHSSTVYVRSKYIQSYFWFVCPIFYINYSQCVDYCIVQVECILMSTSCGFVLVKMNFSQWTSQTLYVIIGGSTRGQYEAEPALSQTGTCGWDFLKAKLWILAKNNNHRIVRLVVVS